MIFTGILPKLMSTGDAYPRKVTDGSLSKPTSTTGGKMLSIPESDRYYEIVISIGIIPTGILPKPMNRGEVEKVWQMYLKSTPMDVDQIKAPNTCGK